MEFLLTLLFWLYGFQTEVPYNMQHPHTTTSIYQHNQPSITPVRGHAVYRKKDVRVRTIVVVDDTIFRPGSVK